ncbi:MAG: hypothetical protein L0H73_01220 [Nitrococcus sp.]|nr:hypothetical protein [Nitrococcus sp.]
MNDLPETTARRLGPGSLELDFTLAPDCPWLEGHFPGRPILPGVVQVGWAAAYASQLAARDEPPMQLQRIKFKRPILPSARLTLALTARDDRVHFEYRMWHEGVQVSASSGILGWGVAQ